MIFTTELKMANSPEEYEIEARKRFWAKVDVPLLEDGSKDYSKCWLVTTKKNKNIHPSMMHKYLGAGKGYINMHRYSYLIHKGDIKEGELVLHIPECSDKHCVNPEHLYIGTAKDNARDVILTNGKRKPVLCTEEEEKKIMKLHEQGVPIRIIAKEIGCNWEKVERAINRMGGTVTLKPRKTLFNTIQEDEICELYLRGWASGAIGRLERFSCDNTTILKIIRKRGIKVRSSAETRKLKRELEIKKMKKKEDKDGKG